MMKWIGNLPTTQSRVVVTLLLVVATAVRYFVGSWAPSVEWLGFLIVMSGLDATQYTAKRLTDATYVAAKQTGTPPTPPSTTPSSGSGT